MIRMSFTSEVSRPSSGSVPIVCPMLHGLTPGQADCAFVMPIANANETLLNTLTAEGEQPEPKERYAAVLCADPFKHVPGFPNELLKLGVTGVVNWPSAIFLEGNMRDAMAAIPASANQEIDWLSHAAKSGLKAAAIVISRDQGLRAIEAGIQRLIIHPGLPQDIDSKSALLLAASLTELIKQLCFVNSEVEILIYCHPLFKGLIDFETIGTDGYVTYEVSS